MMWQSNSIDLMSLFLGFGLGIFGNFIKDWIQERSKNRNLKDFLFLYDERVNYLCGVTRYVVFRCLGFCTEEIPSDKESCLFKVRVDKTHPWIYECLVALSDTELNRIHEVIKHTRKEITQLYVMVGSDLPYNKRKHLSNLEGELSFFLSYYPIRTDINFYPFHKVHIPRILNAICYLESTKEREMSDLFLTVPFYNKWSNLRGCFKIIYLWVWTKVFKKLPKLIINSVKHPLD